MNNYVDTINGGEEWYLESGVWVDGKDIRDLKKDKLGKITNADTLMKEIKRVAGKDFHIPTTALYYEYGTANLNDSGYRTSLGSHCFENQDRTFYLTKLKQPGLDGDSWVLTDDRSAFHLLPKANINNPVGWMEATALSYEGGYKNKQDNIAIAFDGAEIAVARFRGFLVAKRSIVYASVLKDCRFIGDRNGGFEDYCGGRWIALLHEGLGVSSINSHIGSGNSVEGLVLNNVFFKESAIHDPYFYMTNCEFVNTRFIYNRERDVKPDQVYIGGLVMSNCVVETNVPWRGPGDFQGMLFSKQTKRRTPVITDMNMRTVADTKKRNPYGKTIRLDKLIESGHYTFGSMRLSFIKLVSSHDEFDGKLALAATLAMGRDGSRYRPMEFHERQTVEEIRAIIAKTLVSGNVVPWIVPEKTTNEPSVILNSVANQYAQIIHGRLKILRELRDIDNLLE